MKLSWVLFVAGRYFRTRRREKGYASSILAVAGIAIGAATLITVLGVMNGFQLGFIDDILEISSYHLRIEETGDRAFPESDAETVRSVPGVEAVLPFTEVRTMVKGPLSEPHAVLLRGVPGNAGTLDPGLLRYLNITQGTFNFDAPRSVVLGSELARTLGVETGDTVSLLSLGGRGGSTGIQGALRSEDLPFTVTGIFMSGYYLFDLTLGIISDSDAELFLPAGTPKIWGVKLTNRYADTTKAGAVRRALAARGSGTDVRITSWREYNRAFFGALRMEKIMMMVLIGLIFIVVGVNIYHSLKRSVYEKTEEIGVMRAFGAGSRSIQAVFVSEGFLIGLFGGTAGTAAGLLISSRINETFSFLEAVVNGALSLSGFLLEPLLAGGRIEEFSLFSPMYFYLTEVPSRVLFPEVLFVFLFSVLSATGAAFFASSKVSMITPAEVLRYE